jgi:hypothetical protein
VDDRGVRHQVDLRGEGGTLTWQGAIEVEVTGRRSRIRVVVPAGPDMPDT